MESLPSSMTAIYITTAPTNAKVLFSTRSYGGGISDVGVATSSNAVVSNPTSANNIVLYSSGSIRTGALDATGQITTQGVVLSSGVPQVFTASSATFNATGGPNGITISSGANVADGVLRMKQIGLNGVDISGVASGIKLSSASFNATGGPYGVTVSSGLNVVDGVTSVKQIQFPNGGNIGSFSTGINFTPNTQFNVVGVSSFARTGGPVMNITSDGQNDWIDFHKNGLLGWKAFSAVRDLTIYNNSLSQTQLVLESNGFSGVGSTVTPKNTWDVKGNMAVGSYGGVNAAPSNALIVGGNVGIGNSSPNNALEIASGTMRIHSGVQDTVFQIGESSVIIKGSGKVGIGTATPTKSLVVSSGGFMVDGTGAAFTLRDGSQSNGYVLTTDANGVGTWQAAGGGSGDVVLASTQTFTGANTFRSTTTVGYSGSGTTVYTTTITAQSVINGSEALVAVSSFTNLTAVTFSGFVSSATYRIIWNVQNRTNAVNFTMSFVGGVSMGYSNQCWGSAGGDRSTSGESVTPVVLNGSLAQDSSVGTYSHCGNIIVAKEMYQIRTMYYGKHSYIPSSTAQIVKCDIAGATFAAEGTTSPYALNFKMSTGNMDGMIWVYQQAFSQPF